MAVAADDEELGKKQPGPGVETERVNRIKVKATKDAEVLTLIIVCDELGIKLDEALDNEDRRVVHHTADELLERIQAHFEDCKNLARKEELVTMCEQIGLAPDNGAHSGPALLRCLAQLRTKVRDWIRVEKKGRSGKGGWWAALLGR